MTGAAAKVDPCAPSRTAPTARPVSSRPDKARARLAFVAGILPATSETFVYREIRALRERGWQVQAVSLRARPPLHDGGLADLEAGRFVVYGNPWQPALELLAHPLRTLRTLIAAARDALAPGEPTPPRVRAALLIQALAAVGLARRLRSAGVEHVHCHFSHAPTTVGMYAARHLGIPFSFTGHANDIFQRRALLKRKLQRARFVSCISEWHRDFYAAIHPAVAKYRLIRCGVDTSEWRPASSASGAAPPPGEHRILTVCRLVEKKGINTLLHALALASRQARQPFRLTVAGDGPERSKLQTLAARLGIHQHIDWLGAVDNRRVRELMAAADAFVLPCRRDGSSDIDGLPVAIMEAMACGLPVIAGRVPAMRELIADGRTGFIIDADDARGLATLLLRLGRDRSLGQALGRAARQWIEQEFSLPGNVRRLEDALQQR